MSDAVQTAIIIGFFGFLFTTLVSVTVFFIMRLIKTIDKLTDAVERMDKQMINVLNDIDTQATQIAHLAAHRCATEGCPFYDPDKTPTPRLLRTRAEDANGR